MNINFTFDSRDNTTVIKIKNDFNIITVYWNHSTDTFETRIFYCYDESINWIHTDSFNEVKEYLDSVCQIQINFDIE